MTKEDFLARCATAYDMGLVTPERAALMSRWLDVVMREGHSRLCDYRSVAGSSYQDQHDTVRRFWTHSWGEIARLQRNSLARFGDSGDAAIATLANDVDGYSIIQFAAVLSHPCQICATDRAQWHTRPAFCPHQRDEFKQEYDAALDPPSEAPAQTTTEEE